MLKKTAPFTLFLLVPVLLIAQIKVVPSKTLSLPQEKVQLQTLQVLNDGTPVLSMNGGIFSPVDNAWLIAPDNNAPFLDVIMLKDATAQTKLCVLQLTAERVELKYFHRLQDGIAKFRTTQSLPKGIYQVTGVDSANCFIWGKEKQKNVIYAAGLQSQKKFIEIDGNITALHPLTTNSVLVAIDNNIMVLTSEGNLRLLCPVPSAVLSMSVDGMANIWISTLLGVYMLPSGGKKFQGPLLDGVSGLLYIYQSTMWLADPKKKKLYSYNLRS